MNNLGHRKKETTARFLVIVVLFTLVALAIIGKAAYIMFGERAKWEQAASRFTKDSIEIQPHRGNILSTSGKVLASSMPRYKIYMDFMVTAANKRQQEKYQQKRDSILWKNIDRISLGLHLIFPDKSTRHFKQLLITGRKENKRNLLLYPKRISYLELKEIKKLPLFSLSSYSGGFHYETFNNRVRLFGSMAERTIGKIKNPAPNKDSAICGIEYSFDSILRGKPGIKHKQKVMNKYIDFIDKEPIDGDDVVCTINVEMQDIAEEALRSKLEEIGAISGLALLMEVKTGDIKAIVNLERAGNGKYYERTNNALRNLSEPGSTFKVASVMVALEDGEITPDAGFDTGNGIKEMYGRKMRDYNWGRGGFGYLTVEETLMFSSNIGVSGIIDEHYKNKPGKFVDGLYRMGLNTPLHLQLAGAANPYIPHPKDKTYWDLTRLPWMSIGYNTQIPAINLLTFYNAIANNGTMVKPRFVTRIEKDGVVLKEYPVEVIIPQICSKKTLREIRKMIRAVVSRGIAKKIDSEFFPIAGKTGTALLSKGSIGYKVGRVSYYVSFCGYFPADNPKYSCIVGIRKQGVASGGGMAGPVFKKIAEEAYAMDLREQIMPSKPIREPKISSNEQRLYAPAYDTLRIHSDSCWIVPRVIGLSATDATFLLKKEGYAVQIIGKGKVHKQYLTTKARKEITIELN